MHTLTETHTHTRISGHTNIELSCLVNTFGPDHLDVWTSILICSWTKLPTITFPEQVSAFFSSSAAAPCHLILHLAPSYFLFPSLSVWLPHINTHTHACRETQEPWGVAVTHPSGSQVNLPGCQMCPISGLPGVKSPHYRPKAKPRKWMRLSSSLFPVPHDPVTSLCSPPPPPASIPGYDL